MKQCSLTALPQQPGCTREPLEGESFCLSEKKEEENSKGPVASSPSSCACRRQWAPTPTILPARSQLSCCCRAACLLGGASLLMSSWPWQWALAAGQLIYWPQQKAGLGCGPAHLTSCPVFLCSSPQSQPRWRVCPRTDWDLLGSSSGAGRWVRPCG